MSRSKMVGMVLALVAFPAGARAGGGALKGAVHLEGAAPKPAKLSVTKDPAVCGKDKPSEFLILGKENGVKNAVVSLEGVPQGSPPAPATVVIDQKTCQYTPHVQAAPAGSTVELRNSDPVLHNVHGYRQGGTTLFNLAMPVQNQRTKQTLKKAGLSWFRCDAGHTWMSAYVWTFDHPFFAVTNGSGEFAINDVPPGKYKLRVWHEGWKPKGGASSPLDTDPISVDQPVVVEDGKTATVTVNLK